MAFSTTKKCVQSIPGVKTVTVTLLDTAGNSDAENLHDCDTITLQVEGTFASAAVAVQVSNDGATFYALPTAVSISAAGLKSVPADGLGFKFYRLAMTGGGGTTSLTCTLVGVNTSLSRP
jgi:hypothetical protein